MKIATRTLEVATRGRGLYDVTAEIAHFVTEANVGVGLCSVFVKHTSASLVVQENADAAVLRDLERWMANLAPEDASAYEHDAEGPDDMPAHLRASITRASETLPVRDGKLALGTWQAMYLWEHRRAAHTRKLEVTVIGS